MYFDSSCQPHFKANMSSKMFWNYNSAKIQPRKLIKRIIFWKLYRVQYCSCDCFVIVSSQCGRADLLTKKQIRFNLSEMKFI